MHVAVLGAGVIGVTTAYYLAERGYSVTIIDRAAEVAAETSYANGAQLSYSYTDSLARPDFLPQIPSLLLGLDPAIHISAFRNFAMLAWGLKFLVQCTSAKAQDNTVAVLKIALRSAALIEKLQQKLNLDFSYKTAGKLVLLNDASEIRKAEEKMAVKSRCGCETQVLTADEAITKEPALKAMRQDFAGAVYAEFDQVGDARCFTVGLSEWLQRNREVVLRLDEEISGLKTNCGRVVGIRTTQELIEADATVVCLGAWSQKLLQPFRINPSIYPVRGYSVTLPAGVCAPEISVTNLKKRIVYNRLASGIRIAGFADFVGFDSRQDEKRIRMLLQTAQQAAPQAADYSARESHPWGGFRPVTPTGRPQVGRTKLGGLFLNTGHGSLGWTLACATADAVAEDITNSE